MSTQHVVFVKSRKMHDMRDRAMFMQSLHKFSTQTLHFLRPYVPIRMGDDYVGVVALWLSSAVTSSNHAFASFLDMTEFSHDGPINFFYFFARNGLTQVVSQSQPDLN